MHTTNYRDTLITVSPDCPAGAAMAPTTPHTIAGIQYALLADAPYEMTSDDLLFAVHKVRAATTDESLASARTAFFARPQACLRASPLVKVLGWALHHDSDGRVALIDPASARHAELMADAHIVKRPAMRNKRATG